MDDLDVDEDDLDEDDELEEGDEGESDEGLESEDEATVTAAESAEVTVLTDVEVADKGRSG